MLFVRTRPRAFIAAFMPLIAAHVVSVGSAKWRALPDAEFWSSTTPDAVVMLFSARLAPDIAIFAFLHLVLLRLKINGRSAYACAGGVAAVTGYMLSYALGYPFGRPVSGAILSSVLPLFGLGALCGFLYLRIAGYAGGRPALSAGAPEAMQACDTPSAFDGPLRVRFSFGSMVVAAFVPPLLTGLLSQLVEGLALSAELISASINGIPAAPIDPSGWGRTYVAQNAGAVMLVTYVTVIASFTAVPMMVLNICALGIARFRHSTDYWAFVKAGAIVGAIVTLPVAVAFNLTFFLPLVIIYPAAMGALAAVVYRWLTGLEPVPLPEPVIVDDQASLAAMNDPSRQMHPVLMQK